MIPLHLPAAPSHSAVEEEAKSRKAKSTKQSTAAKKAQLNSKKEKGRDMFTVESARDEGR